MLLDHSFSTSVRISCSQTDLQGIGLTTNLLQTLNIFDSWILASTPDITDLPIYQTSTSDLLTNLSSRSARSQRSLYNTILRFINQDDYLWKILSRRWIRRAECHSCHEYHISPICHCCVDHHAGQDVQHRVILFLWGLCEPRSSFHIRYVLSILSGFVRC